MLLTFYKFTQIQSKINCNRSHFQKDLRDELIQRLKEENANLQLQNDLSKERISFIQQDSLAKEQLLKDANEDALQKMAQLASLSKIIEGMKFRTILS